MATDPRPKNRLILVTGATGRIGRVVVADLLARGYAVRAVTSGRQLDGHCDEALEWRHADLLDTTDLDVLLDGCQGLVHLAAELRDESRMWQLNARATEELARAAERQGVTAFCYVSSVAVYGSGLERETTEDSPVVDVDRDVPSQYWNVDYVRTYARTKLAGEKAIRQVACAVRHVILRPTVVVDVPEVISIRDWSPAKRMIAAHRHAHHIYVGDVSEAVIWAMERALAGAVPAGAVETFNVADDDGPDPTHAAFMRQAFAVSGDPRFRVWALPPVVDWTREFLRFRRLPLRNPFWRMHFSTTRLQTAGFRLKFGLGQLHALALSELRRHSPT